MDIITIHYPVRTPEEIRPLSVAIGHFDGVHKGHQNVIRRCVEQARSSGQLAAVMTFHPHPKEVLGHGSQYVTCLTPLSDKIERFRKLGVDVVYVVQFDLDFSRVAPEEFVEGVLRPLQVKRVVVGFDFRFGSQGAGSPQTLRELCKQDMQVEVVEPLMQDDEKISSTLIRKRLACGEPDVAHELIGEPYSVSGKVVTGEGRGRTLGFPTANIEVEPVYVVPKQGVYAIMACFDHMRVSGVLNLGVKPTFHDHFPQPVFEAHLFNFEGDLYGKTIRLQILEYIRPEKKFSSIQELIEQIHNDAEQARMICASYQ